MDDPDELRDTEMDRVGVADDDDDLLVRVERDCVGDDVKDADPESDTDHESLGDPDELWDSREDRLTDPDPDELGLEDGDGADEREVDGVGHRDPVQSPERVDVCVSRDDADELLVADKLRDIVFGAEVVGVDDAERDDVVVAVDVMVGRGDGDPDVVAVPDRDTCGERDPLAELLDVLDCRTDDVVVRDSRDDAVVVVLSEYDPVSSELDVPDPDREVEELAVDDRDARTLGVSERDPSMLGVALRVHHAVHVEVAVGSDVGVGDVEKLGAMVRECVGDEDADRVPGRDMDAVEEDVALRVRNGPCVPVGLDDVERDSCEDRVGVRVDVAVRLAEVVADRDCVCTDDADDVAECVLLVVPTSVRVLQGVLVDERDAIADTVDVDVELDDRVPTMVCDDVEVEDVLFDAPSVRDVVDDADALRERGALPVDVKVARTLAVPCDDAVAVRVGTGVHVAIAVAVDVRVPMDVCV